MKSTSTLGDIFSPFRKNLILIIAIVVITVFAGIIYSVFIVTPTYKSSAEILVVPVSGTPEENLETNDIQTNLQLIITYKEFITSPIVLSGVIESLDLTQSITELQNNLSVENTPESQILVLTVEDTNAQQSATIANEIAKNFIEQANTILGVSNLTVISAATAPSSTASPNIVLNTILALIIGIVLSILTVLVKSALDNTIRESKDLEFLETPIYGEIPVATMSGNTIISAEIDEAIRTLRTNLIFSDYRDQIRTLTITSSNSSEGKSTIAIELAKAFSLQGKKVLLIDSDLRKPAQHSKLLIRNNIGLSNILVKDKSIEECIKPTQVPNFSVITSGPIPPNPSEIISFGMKNVLKEVTSLFDLVVIDAPPILPVADSLVLSSMSDKTLFIVRSRKTKLEDAKKAFSQLLKIKDNSIGIVLNQVELDPKAYEYGFEYDKGKKRG